MHYVRNSIEGTGVGHKETRQIEVMQDVICEMPVEDSPKFKMNGKESMFSRSSPAEKLSEKKGKPNIFKKAAKQKLPTNNLKNTFKT